MSRVVLGWGLVLALGMCLWAEAKPKPSVKEALASGSAAWAIRGDSDEFRVRVSPAGKTLKMIPRVGRVVGTGVDAVVNDKYRVAIKEALGDYDLGKTFVSHLQERLEEVCPGIGHVSALGSTAGFHTLREAQKARWAHLGKSGYRVLLDLDVDYGIYGAGFDMRFTFSGSALRLPEGGVLWRGSLPIALGAFAANHKFGSILTSQIPFATPPRLSVEEDAAVALTGDDAGLLKGQFEQAVHAAVSAMLCDMGLADEALGNYYLGRRAFHKKKFEKASEYFERALKQDAGLQSARNDLAVALAKQKQIDKAIELALQIPEEAPEFGTASFNLAWWLALDKKAPEKARPYYEKSRQAGKVRDKKLDAVFEEQGGGTRRDGAAKERV